MRKKYGTVGRIMARNFVTDMVAALIIFGSLSVGVASAEVLTDTTGDWFIGINGNPATGYSYTDIISANIEQISPTELKATTVVNGNIPAFGWHGYRWFFDTDRSITTGQSYYLFNDIGVDYWVEVAGSSGTPNPSIAIWKNDGFQIVKRITNYSVQANKVEVTFSIADIGNPSSFYWIADTTDGIQVNDHAPNSGHGTISLSPSQPINSNVSNLNLNGQGNYIEVNPGTTISGTASYTIWDSSCPSCIKQLVIGLNNNPQTCIFNEIPGAYPGKSGTASFSLTAPTMPSDYIVGWTEDAMYTCNDAKNNFPSKSKSMLGTIKVIDTPPTISIGSPSNGQILTTSTITVSGTASDNVGLSKVEVKVGSGSWQLASDTATWSKQMTLSEGSNIIYARATDTAGNSKETSVTVSYAPLPTQTTVPPTTVPPTTVPPTTVPPTTVPPTPTVKLPSLTVSHTTSKEKPEVGEEVLIAVTVLNNGEGAAKNIRLTEQLPSSVTVSYIDGATSNTPNLVTWNGELAPNRAHAILHTLKIVEKKSIAIPVTILYEDEAGNTGQKSATINVGAQATATPTPEWTKAPEPTVQEVKVKAPGFTGLLVLIGLVAAIGFARRR